MNIGFSQSRPERFPVFKQFFFFISVTFTCLLIFSVLGAKITVYLYNIDFDKLANIADSNLSEEVIKALKFYQAFFSIGVLFIPAVFMSYYFRSRPLRFLKLDKSIAVADILIVLMLFVFIFPFLEWLIDFNNKMTLPPGLKGVEEWMREKENANDKLMDVFLRMNGFWEYFINLILIAFLPAVLEEIFFRGVLQKLMVKWLRHSHAAIILTAVLFSAVHMQFFGFLPRLVLGLMLGYLFFWTGSLWTSIFAHFLNNAVTVTLLYLSQKNFITYENNTPMVNSNLVTIISFAVAAGFFLFLANYYNRRRNSKNGWKKIYTASNLAEAEILKGRLENYDITSIIMKKETIYVSNGPVDLMVSPEDEEQALEIIGRDEPENNENSNPENTDNE